MTGPIQQFRIAIEPEGETYQGLLTFACGASVEALLVVMPGIPLSDAAAELLDRLHDLGARRETRSSWPGTKLHRATADVILVATSGAVLEVLVDGPQTLFGWIQPAWPEDLAFLRSDGSPLLGSISHERDAFLRLLPDELAHLMRLAGRIHLDPE